MSYALRFIGNDERPYLFEGQRQVTALAFARTMSTLPGSIFEASSRTEIARALLRFDIQRDAIKFLRSFHLV